MMGSLGENMVGQDGIAGALPCLLGLAGQLSGQVHVHVPECQLTKAEHRGQCGLLGPPPSPAGPQAEKLDDLCGMDHLQAGC